MLLVVTDKLIDALKTCVSASDAALLDIDKELGDGQTKDNVLYRMRQDAIYANAIVRAVIAQYEREQNG